MRLLVTATFWFWLVVPGLAWAAGDFQLLYMANRQGELEPCGCQTGPIGGLDRALNYIEGVRRKEVPQLVVDSGDTFFAFSEGDASRKAQAIARARVIAEAYRKMGVQALLPGERDFAEGTATLEELKQLGQFSLVASNLKVPIKENLIEPSKILTLAGQKVGILGVVDPPSFVGVKEVEIRPAIASLKQAVSDLRKQGVKTIFLLSHLGLAQDREVARLGLVDVILGAHSMDVVTPSERVGRTLITQPDIEGKQIGLVEYSFKAPHKNLHHLVDLGASYEKANTVSALMKKYNEEVRNLALAQPAPPTIEAAASAKSTAKPPFRAHAFECRSCHQAQYDFWAGTHHASAYLVLYAKNQHFDPECISCHSLGFDSAQGFSKIAHPLQLNPPLPTLKKGEVFVENLMKKVFSKDPGSGPLDSRVSPDRYKVLQNAYQAEVHHLEDKKQLQKLYIGVQCEHCHGNRAGHPGGGFKPVGKVQSSSCVQCHTPPNDTDFNFAAQVAKVACPKMRP